MYRLLTVVLLAFFATSAFGQTDSANYFFQKGLTEKQNGRRMESLKNFEKAAKYNPNDKAITAELASAYLDLRKYYQAKESYKKLLELGDQSAATYKQLLQLAFNLKTNDEVITYANKLKQIDPSEKINYYVGKVNYDNENYGEAIKYLTAAAKDDPSNAEIPYMIGRSYADMDNYKLAIPYYQKAIETDPSKYGWIYELAMICYANNDSKSSVKYFELAAEKGYPMGNDYYMNLGIAHLDAGNFEQGTTILNDLLKKRPSDFNLLNMLAEAYYFKGKYDDAMNYWDTLLGYDKTNAAALYMIGMCYQKKGDKAKGTALCDKAIEMNPSLASYKTKRELPIF